MITHYHDYGWGMKWPIKKLEQEITDLYLAPMAASRERVVIVNSTWYSQHLHTQIMEWLTCNAWDRLVLVAMIDAAIPSAGWFEGFNRPVTQIGSYRGPYHVSLWAEATARYISPCADYDITVPFMCLNRKPHEHRTKLYSELEVSGLLDQGLVSLGSPSTQPALRNIPELVPVNDLAPNGSIVNHGIPNDIQSLGDLSNWRRHFLNVVTETVFDVDAQYFVSEKIFKPILGHRPFLVYAVGGAQKWLQDQGFEPYLNDFNDITDLDLRDADNIAPFLSLLCKQGCKYWRHKYIDLLPKIHYNLHMFAAFIAEQRQRIQQGIICPI